MKNALNWNVKATTVLAIKHNGVVAMGADGQATIGEMIVVKSTVKKIRKLADGKILAGFAGSTADAFALLERFESKLNAHASNMYRAALSLAKAWRTDTYLRNDLHALLVVCDKEQILQISGSGDVMKPEYDITAIGSGGPYAYSAALALKKYASQLSAVEMVTNALKIAADLCVYTNKNLVVESLS